MKIVEKDKEENWQRKINRNSFKTIKMAAKDENWQKEYILKLSQKDENGSESKIWNRKSVQKQRV